MINDTSQSITKSFVMGRFFKNHVVDFQSRFIASDAVELHEYDHLVGLVKSAKSMADFDSQNEAFKATRIICGSVGDKIMFWRSLDTPYFAYFQLNKDCLDIN